MTSDTFTRPVVAAPAARPSTLIRSLPATVHEEAVRNPDRTVLTALDRDGQTAEVLTWAELDRQARALATDLRAVAVPGDRVLVPAMPDLRFHVAFLACLYGDLVAVPVPPIRPAGLRSAATGKRANRLDRLLAICADAAPAAAVVPGAVVDALAQVAAGEPVLRRMHLVAAEPHETTDPIAVPQWVDPAEVAFLQYTSGSTAAPRGVVITHGAMIANQRIIAEHLRITSQSTVVSWLPVYHDMGLCAGLLQPVYVRGEAVVMAPETFMVRPERWLRAISGRRDVISPAPDFAYALCAARIGPEVRRELDLSGWRVALSGAEPVRADTMRAFTEAFADSGLPATAPTAGYGLAESTLFVSGGRAGEPLKVGRFDREELAHALASAAGPDAAAAEVVGCGGPVAEVEVAIVDPITFRRCRPGTVGEIWVDSPSNGTGYWGQEESSREIFAAELADEPGRGWLRTGDLGFLEGAELFVTGRLKDVVIIRGANYYPHDFERLVQAADPLLAGGIAAAFGTSGTDSVTVVAEVARDVTDSEAHALTVAAARAVAEHLPVATGIVLVPRGKVPRTTSGKVRRGECAAHLSQGKLPVLARWPREAA
ncbi:fatty acyl-AMP ligase [Krasilnikovia sp. MM14-A1259]|uniref:fatty acyl-AMP ligase n=1 Tax=Krasilnikovia sp. MM14-A1259 TaxID=3373539 RepID=UPI00382E915F